MNPYHTAVKMNTDGAHTDTQQQGHNKSRLSSSASPYARVEMGFELAMQDVHGRRLGDMGDTLATLLIVIICLIGFCAFLGWYSRRRG